MNTAKRQEKRASTEVILSMVEHRPCSVQQITQAFSARSYEVIKLLSNMVRRGQVMVKSTDEGLFIVSPGSLHH